MPTHDECGAGGGHRTSFQDAAWYSQLQEDRARLGAAITRLRYGESPLALRGALWAILAVSSSEAWTGTFAHLAARRERMLPLLEALDARYEFLPVVPRPLDVDAVRAIGSGTAAMIVLPLASDLFDALVAVSHERDLVLRLTRRHPQLVEGPRRRLTIVPGHPSQPNEKAPPCSS